MHAILALLGVCHSFLPISTKLYDKYVRRAGR